MDGKESSDFDSGSHPARNLHEDLMILVRTCRGANSVGDWELHMVRVRILVRLSASELDSGQISANQISFLRGLDSMDMTWIRRAIDDSKLFQNGNGDSDPGLVFQRAM